MPVEIRELIVKAIVSDDRERETAPSDSLSSEKKEKLISECVEAALQILKEKQER